MRRRGSIASWWRIGGSGRRRISDNVASSGRRVKPAWIKARGGIFFISFRCASKAAAGGINNKKTEAAAGESSEKPSLKIWRQRRGRILALGVEMAKDGEKLALHLGGEISGDKWRGLKRLASAAGGLGVKIESSSSDANGVRTALPIGFPITNGSGGISFERVMRRKIKRLVAAGIGNRR